MQRLILCALIMLTSTSLAFGSITIQVGDGNQKFLQGTQAVIPVYLYSTYIEDEVLANFTMGMDFGNPGKDSGLEPYASWLNGNAISASFTGSPFTGGFASVPGTSNRNFDILVQGLGGSVPLEQFPETNKLRIFDLKFTVAANATPGRYNFTFINPANFSTTNQNNFVGTAYGGEFTFTELSPSASFNYFDVEEVPEPSTIALLALGLVSGAAYRRVRRRSSSKVAGNYVS
jgi:hypothetical protein